MNETGLIYAVYTVAYSVQQFVMNDLCPAEPAEGNGVPQNGHLRLYCIVLFLSTNLAEECYVQNPMSRVLSMSFE